jgi:hypothetical protein
LIQARCCKIRAHTRLGRREGGAGKSQSVSEPARLSISPVVCLLVGAGMEGGKNVGVKRTRASFSLSLCLLLVQEQLTEWTVSVETATT